jgi:hypothetical protein
MDGNMFGAHVTAYPAIATALAASSGNEKPSRQDRKRTESIRFRRATSDELKGEYFYRSIDRRWNNELASDGYSVMQIQTTEHQVAVKLKNGDTMFLSDFEGESGVNETTPVEDDLDFLRPVELEKLITDWAQVGYLVVVSKTTARNVEVVYWVNDYYIPTGKSWPDRIRYDIEVLLLQR